MKEFTYTIKEPVGIHARPAGMLAKEAKTCQSTVTIVDKNEYQKLMNYMNQEDPQAFITVYTVSDIRYRPKV